MRNNAVSNCDSACRRRGLCLALWLAAVGVWPALAQQAPLRTVIAVQAEPSRIARAERLYRTLGEVASVDKVDVTTQRAGTVDTIFFRDGQSVSAGAHLIQMDSRTAISELRSSTAQLNLARQTLARTQELTARSLRTVADQQRDSAAAVAAEADFQARSVALGILTIKAPFAGVITNRRISAGAFVSPGQPIATLQNLDRVLVRFRVPQRLTAAVQVGQVVRVESNIDNRQAVTQIARIDPVLDADTRLLSIEAEVTDARDVLRPGSFVRIALVLSVSEQAVIVPAVALVQSLTGDFLYVVRDGVARRVAVRVGEKRDGFTEIIEGLPSGAQVITDGQFKVQDGAAVRVIAAAAPAPAASR